MPRYFLPGGDAIDQWGLNPIQSGAEAGYFPVLEMLGQQLFSTSRTARKILLVDDNPDDVALIRRCFERARLPHQIISVASGIDALAYLAGDAPYNDRFRYPLPDLMLLDIKMPAIDGFEVLRWVRQQKKFSGLCVVMLTSSDEIRDVNQAYHLGATSFLVKPLDFWNAVELSNSLDKLLAKAQQRPQPV